MSYMLKLMPPEIWMQQIFEAKAARQGGIVRRKTRDIERVVGRRQFEEELRRRGYHAVENGDQIVIFCNNEPIRLFC